MSSNYLIAMSHTDVINDEGQSPLDLALEIPCDVGCIDVALYLINHGCGDDEDKDKLLCEACWWGKLDVVKELVEEHDRDPKGECRVLTNMLPCIGLVLIDKIVSLHI